MGNKDDKIKGKANQAAGAVREKTGDLTNNEKMQAKGKAQHAKGDGQETKGKIKDAGDSVKDAAKSVAGR